jgi:hypothetical protein
MEALAITGIECPSKRFSLRLETNQIGQSYTLFLKLSGEGNTGRTADSITLRTSNNKQPVLLIGASTLIHERVHTFPEDLDFGTIEAARIQTNAAQGKHLTQVLMVYQDGGSNLQVTAKADLPFLSIRSEPSGTGEQVQIEVALKPQELRAGEFLGRLQLQTNDREFPSIEIPVRGQIR